MNDKSSLSDYEVVTLHEWLGKKHCCDNDIPSQEEGKERVGNRTIEKAKIPLPLIDLRSEESFAERHILSICRERYANDLKLRPDEVAEEEKRKVTLHLPVVVNLPIENLLSGERSCELPPRNVEFAILVPSLEIDTQSSERCNGNEGGRKLYSSGEKLSQDQILDFFFATSSKTTLQSRKPWMVRQIIQDCEQTWIDANQLGLFARKHDRIGNQNDDDVPNNIIPLPRLWRPDAMIENTILPLLKERMDMSAENIRAMLPVTAENFHVINPKARSLVWDLGSGAGRDVCFLAEELKFYSYSHGYDSQEFQFVGIDYHKGSARRCLPLWKYRQVAGLCSALLMDLNKVEMLQTNIAREEGSLNTADEIQNGVVLLYAIRYLNRKMINYIVDKKCALKTGTLFAMSHFCKKYEGASWDFDHPKESNVLDRNELNEKFEGTGRWKVLHNELYPDGDHGRTLQHFVAEKIS